MKRVLLILAFSACGITARANTYMVLGQRYELSEQEFNAGCELAVKVYPIYKKYGKAWRESPEGKELVALALKASAGYSQAEADNITKLARAKVTQMVINDKLGGFIKL